MNGSSQSVRVLLCNCTRARVIPPRVKREVLRRLSNADVTFEVVADLCELAAVKDPALNRMAGFGDLRVAACHPRAVKSLFQAAGAPLADERVDIQNMRTNSAADVAASLLSDLIPPEEPWP
jgi:hypothetical protein